MRVEAEAGASVSLALMLTLAGFVLGLMVSAVLFAWYEHREHRLACEELRLEEDRFRRSRLTNQWHVGPSALYEHRRGRCA